MFSCSGPCRYRVEICSNKALDELLWRRRDAPYSLQCHPEPQVPLVPGQVDMDSSVQEKDEKKARKFWNHRGKNAACSYCAYFLQCIWILLHFHWTFSETKVCFCLFLWTLMNIYSHINHGERMVWVRRVLFSWTRLRTSFPDSQITRSLSLYTLTSGALRILTAGNLCHFRLTVSLFGL